MFLVLSSLLSYLESCVICLFACYYGVSSLSFLFFFFVFLLAVAVFSLLSLLLLFLLLLLFPLFSDVVVVVGPSTLTSPSSLHCSGTRRASLGLRLRGWLICFLSCVDLLSGDRPSCRPPSLVGFSFSSVLLFAELSL